MSHISIDEELYSCDEKIEDGFLIKEYPSMIEVYCNQDCIRIAKQHKVYIKDIKRDFYLYHRAVQPIKNNDFNIVDFSKPTTHTVNGFSLFDVKIPSFIEDINTVHQYIAFAQLQSNSVVLDLGSYSGLSAILFDIEIAKQETNSKGKVITIDADISNIDSIQYNLQEYSRISKRNIEFLHCAVWREDGTIEFASEGHMAASVNNVFLNRGKTITVPTLCLSSIAKQYNLDHIDFIKCDIEGAETEIFKDNNFFQQFSPRIIIEAHYIHAIQATSVQCVIEQLSQYGYKCKEIKQHGFGLPLIECVKE